MYHSLAASRRPRDAESVLQAKPRHWRDKLFTAVEEFTNEIRTAPRKLKVSLEAASRPPKTQNRFCKQNLDIGEISFLLRSKNLPMNFRTTPRKLKVSLEAASRRPRDAESVLQAKPRHWRDKLFTAVEEFTNEILHCSKKIKSFAQAFSKACRVEGRSPSWVLRAKPLTSLSL